MLKLHVFNTGWASVQEKQLYVGGSSHTRTVPVLAFVIEHPTGLVVFDTGLHPAFAAHARQHIGWLGNPLLPFCSAPGMNLSVQMKAKNLPPEEVRCVVLSHLHYDHTGELRAFPHAQLLATRPEWQAAQSPFRHFRGYLGKEYNGLTFSLVDFPLYNGEASNQSLKGAYGLNLLEDSSLILVPTFGHTRGHQSLLVSLPYGVVLLAGDAVYVRENYAKPAIQPRTHFPESAWRSLIGIRALIKGDPSALILPTHDDSALRGLQRSDIVIGDMYYYCETSY